MIRNQLFKLNFILNSTKRNLQFTTVYYKNYVERNDNLLDIDEILNEDKRVIKTVSPKVENQKIIKKSKTLKSVKKLSKEYKKSFYETDPIIRQQFIDDVNTQENYPNQLVLEGKNLINDVIAYGYPEIIRIYYDEEKKLNKIDQLDKLKNKGVQFKKIDYTLMQAHSDVVTPQGLFGIIRLNVDNLFELNQKKNQNEVPLILVLNNISDPGNMGTLIRSSLGCGIQKFLCLKKCTQLLKSKVLRSSAGSIFQLPFKENIDIQNLKDHLPDNSKIYIADSNLNLSDYILDKKSFDEDSLINSLNENKSSNNLNEELSNDKIDCIEYDIKCLNYTDINYFDKPDNCVVLIINGETGITNEIRELIKNNNCTRINIPLANNVDSLNTSIAGSIIMYEIKRQFLLNNK